MNDNNDSIIGNVDDGIHERIKYLRKNILSLSRTSFAEEINFPRPVISRAEKGGKVSKRLISLICSGFKVNEEWLRYGKEPVFVEKYKHLSEREFNLLSMFNKLEETDKLTIIKMVSILYGKTLDKSIDIDF